MRVRERPCDEVSRHTEPGRDGSRGRGGIRDQLLVAQAHRSLRHRVRRGHVPAPGPGRAGGIRHLRELVLTPLLDPEARVRAERQVRVVGTGPLGAEPAALEQRGRDVAPVADDVDRDRLGVGAERGRSTKLVSGVCSTPRSPEASPRVRTRWRILRSTGAISSSGRPISPGIAAFQGCTSSRSTKPGSDPSARPVKVVPERGEPTTKTSRSSEPSLLRLRAIRTALRP